ncbi:ABC transporter ATP-binding protein [Oceanidesulfovibrio indonesiensis]|uniref:ABC transporter ATP-binding protein n=1 Tax=Oceanidesulfovibrio indonesiensis TaxID=54767 RepID=A0A7M3MBZ6_9BACT|nr:ABC transporter ATP-binding protein [Oceanidesulfovibrio indonesiensis]TVM15799.1 ABC transporter ATP-binding protein [Oceanidesulfovibrio indonesiensis]
MNVVQATNAVKRFGEFEAVRSMSFHVKEREFFALLGPNGAGKTSMIRMLYGFSPITSGEVRVFGMNVQTEWRTIRGRIGVCQQENTLDPDLTVEQNLRLFASYFSIPGNTARERTEELLDFFALSHKRDAKVMELSGGMARRLMLARAIISKPDLLILDEPTTGLDPQSRHQVWERLRRLKSQGLTLMLTTHYMEEAEFLCDRLIIMDHGEVLVEGTPKALIARHVGGSVIEVDDPDEAVMRFIREKNLSHDALERRVLIYADDAELELAVREKFCSHACTFRPATLEDVFLRLTGRELRE